MEPSCPQTSLAIHAHRSFYSDENSCLHTSFPFPSSSATSVFCFTVPPPVSRLYSRAKYRARSRRSLPQPARASDRCISRLESRITILAASSVSPSARSKPSPIVPRDPNTTKRPNADPGQVGSENFTQYSPIITFAVAYHRPPQLHLRLWKLGRVSCHTVRCLVSSTSLLMITLVQTPSIEDLGALVGLAILPQEYDLRAQNWRRARAPSRLAACDENHARFDAGAASPEPTRRSCTRNSLCRLEGDLEVKTSMSRATLAAVSCLDGIRKPYHPATTPTRFQIRLLHGSSFLSRLPRSPVFVVDLLLHRRCMSTPFPSYLSRRQPIHPSHC
ncbi:hypothetical protein C8R45DRAFT_162448 [Mycena sanguinolenta]|nr:hypothetical protein C8R45DRAFT_162448 [Mycena sanguinolenta]